MDCQCQTCVAMPGYVPDVHRPAPAAPQPDVTGRALAVLASMVVHEYRGPDQAPLRDLVDTYAQRPVADDVLDLLDVVDRGLGSAVW